MGRSAPLITHRMVVLLRRIVVSSLAFAVALLTLAAVAVGSGRDVIADYQNNGRVTGCYSAAEFREALRILRADERLYGNAIEVIQEARSTNVARPGEPCEPALTAPEEAVEDDGGSGMGLWLGLAAAVGVVAVGAGLWARRGGGGDGRDGDGPDAS